MGRLPFAYRAPPFGESLTVLVLLKYDLNGLHHAWLVAQHFVALLAQHALPVVAVIVGKHFLHHNTCQLLLLCREESHH